ncbi:heavy metal translocating P-type ATPase [Sinirhodobacter populi]|uniref:P-type Zn(2+) transporter n=1 Tax=Paenirhodobacter populi TaxID=2306993 RepID=A0A443K3R0_9RHOB|nr:heavy metal translocating P-type ATPase [Sinirhodobacter populi]RWR27343.1 heavy metal translocating P-type ATPase [Sinirhodobacter populi]
MTQDFLLSRAEAVHCLPARVRFRCAFRDAGQADWPMLTALALGIDGVKNARASAHARSLVLGFDPAVTDPARIREELLSLGAQAAKARGDSAPAHAARNALLTSAVVLFGIGWLPRALQFGISAVAASSLFREAGEDLAHEGITSRVLEGLAVAISLTRGDYAVANTTGFLLSLGEYLSETTARRSDMLLRELLRPAHPSVWVMRYGQEVEIPADEVVIGDTVIVAAGSVLPVDGRVLSGLASVNEAALTGEATLVEKKRGAKVLSGALVQEGRIAVYAESVGAGTVAARIAEYVERSLAAKGRMQLDSAQLADQLVPTILRVATASFLISGDWRRPASVLQADYSCALKLATPIAFRSAMYGAGQSGILIKGADALERLAEADTYVFDKTGTLTTGVLEVTDAIAFDADFSPEDLICLAASVEEHYAFHPLAMAVVEAARATGHNKHFDHQEVEFIVAHGVASSIDGKRIVVGSRHFVEDDEGIDCSAHRGMIDHLFDEGKTVLFVGFGGRLLGIIGLEDTLRPSAAASIARLRELGGKRILMLTGDREDRAQEIAAALGLDGYHADLLPEDKARIIEELGRSGARIAFVGDGINDAPALARAYVGIAMNRGADIARLTADIVLLEDDIAGITDAVEIAREVMDVIRVSFRLTIGLNTTILAGAALGLLSPLATSVLHNGSTIAILLNVLRRHIGPAQRSVMAPVG